MPKTSTHLHLALKLAVKMKIDDEIAFMLGCAYADCEDKDERREDDLAERQLVPEGYKTEMLKRHYKTQPQDNCDLKAFLKENSLDDFNLGWYFHLWADNAIKQVDVGDITPYDCVICDMPVIYRFARKVTELTFTGKQGKAAENILAMANRPAPLYMVDDEKADRYDKILDNLAERFARKYNEFTK